MTDVPFDPSGSQHHPTGLRSAPHRYRLVGVVVVVVGLLAALFAFGLNHDPSYVRSAVVGHPAPTFDLPMLSGPGTLNLASLKGKVVVLNFWASWCVACRTEHPNLAAAWSRFRDQGMVLVGIPFTDRLGDSRAFARELRMDWPLVQDPGSRTAIRYGVYGPPETFIISRSGVVACKVIGPVTYATLSDQIGRLLANRPAVAADGSCG